MKQFILVLLISSVNYSKKSLKYLTSDDLNILLGAGLAGINTTGIGLNCALSYDTGDINSRHFFELNESIYQLICGQIWIREPEDPNNILTIIKTKIEYIETVKEVVKTLIVPVVTELKDIENCFICDSNKAIVSFSCCSINYCPQCAIKIVKTKPQCAQCRKDVDVDKIVSLVK